MQIRKLFRVGEWLVNKLLFNFCLLLVVFVYTHPGGLEMLKITIYFILYIISVGSLGYLINDYFDIEEDKMAGKINFVSQLRGSIVIILFVILLTIAIVPFAFYELSFPYYYILLGIQLLAFMVYSIPPFRFKKNVLGVFADSIYSFMIPGLITLSLGYNFNLFQSEDILMLAVFCFWLLLSGIRSILLHQIKDINADLNSGNHTLAIKSGTNLIVLIAWVIMVLEFVSLAFICVFCYGNLWVYIMSSIVLFLIIEGLITKNMKFVFKDISSFAGNINNLYNTYFICGVSILAATELHYIFYFVASAIVIFKLRMALLDLIRKFYYKIILYIYYKSIGLIARFKKK